MKAINVGMCEWKAVVSIIYGPIHGDMTLGGQSASYNVLIKAPKWADSGKRPPTPFFFFLLSLFYPHPHFVDKAGRFSFAYQPTWSLIPLPPSNALLSHVSSLLLTLLQLDNIN